MFSKKLNKNVAMLILVKILYFNQYLKKLVLVNARSGEEVGVN